MGLLLGSRRAILSGLSGDVLPINIDFTALPDGGLPAALVGSTWAISSAAAVNTPTLGAELLTDPGLEAAYVSGTCGTLTKTGSPTVADETVDVHGGAHAQAFTAAAFNNRLNWAAAAATARQWYAYSVWAKRVSGTASTTNARIDISNALPAASIGITVNDAAYTQKKMAILATDTSNMFRYALIETNAAGDAVLVDDGSYKAITYSSLFAITPLTQTDVIVKCKFGTITEVTPFGLIARADSQTSPTHYIMALVVRHPSLTTSATVYLIKKVGNTYTAITSGGVTVVAGAWLELRLSGTGVKVYYNNLQVSTDQTVSDTEIVSNKYHGLISSGGARITNFFAQAN